MTPFFSVVIPLYNKEKYIQATIESVLNQTFQDFEIIIVNDGSTDGSFNIVKKITDSRIFLYTNKNNGLSYSRNYGIKKAKAKYIALLDADDLWMEDFLETIHQLINTNKEKYIFATNVKLLPPNVVPDLSFKLFTFEKTKIISNYFNLKKNILSPSSLVVHKSVFEVVGFFDETVNYGEEYDFYARCFNSYKLVYYHDFKIYYRTGVPNQLTAPNKSIIRKIPDYEKYLNIYKNPALKFFFDFVHYELVVLYKMEKNQKLVKFYKQKIDVYNLTTIQKIKYYLPIEIFYITKCIYIWFSKRFIHC